MLVCEHCISMHLTITNKISWLVHVFYAVREHEKRTHIILFLYNNFPTFFFCNLFKVQQKKLLSDLYLRSSTIIRWNIKYDERINPYTYFLSFSLNSSKNELTFNKTVNILLVFFVGYNGNLLCECSVFCHEWKIKLLPRHEREPITWWLFGFQSWLISSETVQTCQWSLQSWYQEPQACVLPFIDYLSDQFEKYRHTQEIKPDNFK